MRLSATAIRAALRHHFGPRRYRITATGEIHAHGRMPNTNTVGWYLYGWMGDAGTAESLWELHRVRTREGGVSCD